MKLGNSKGNNTGKKYFVRKGKEFKEPKPANSNKAAKFNEWFSVNCRQLMDFLISKNTHDDDVFNTTYIRIVEKLLYTNESIDDYKAYFFRSYYTNYILERTRESRFVPMAFGNNLEAHHDNPYERERMQTQLEIDIFEYVYKHYQLKEFELFKMYITLKPAINYKTLSAITHVQKHNIQRIISRILSDIRSNTELVNRFKEIK